MSKNSGHLVEIIDGKYAGKVGIANHKKQEKIFLADKKLVITVYENLEFKKVIAENVTIHTSKLKGIGMCD